MLGCAKSSVFNRTIEQTCSWACCPEIKITVSLQNASSAILKTHRPSLTITSLSNAVVSKGLIEIKKVSNNATQSGTWNDGTLQLNPNDLMPASSRAEAFVFQFTVKDIPLRRPWRYQ